MSRLIESIRLFNGQFSRLEVHQARLDNSFQDVFSKKPDWRLESRLQEETIPSSGLYKCRVEYDDKQILVSFDLYQPRQIRTLKLVEDNTLEYNHKWANREALERAFAKRGDCDDVLIVRNGLITDSFYANIVFRKSNNWYTPQSYLLPGTMRQFLVKTGVITEHLITEKNLREFDQFKLINAMLEWDSPAFDVSNIY